MRKKIKVAVLKETKTPPDKRVVLTPREAVEFCNRFQDVELVIQKSDIRAFDDSEYSELGLALVDDVSDCDVLLGVKEVEISKLIANKKYFFFSHTAKKQEYNKPLLQELLNKNIQMVDHEYLTDIKGDRLVAFGRWAGLVGAYNGLIAYGKRTGLFELKRAIDSKDTVEMFNNLKNIKLPSIKILITGGGRVAHGAVETLSPMNIKQVSPNDFLNKTFDEAVFTQLNPRDYVERIDGSEFDLHHFFRNPEMYKSKFLPYTKVADLFIACHFWDEKSPKFFTKEDAKLEDFNISVIADVSCDIAEPIPSTIRPSEIAEPFYGYNPRTEIECDAFDKNNITVMAVDNLPGEVPRDASADFGKGLIDKVFPSLFDGDTNGIIERATITKDGKLGKHFEYLKDFAESE